MTNPRRRRAETGEPPAFTLTILLQHVGKLLEDQMRVGFERIGLHPAQGHVLHLLEWGEGVSQRELTVAMRIAAPTVSGILKRMEAAGLIQRRSDADDVRIARVFLTRKGRAMGQAARAAVEEVEQVLIADLSRNRQRTVHALLRQLRDNLGGAPPGPEPPVREVVS